ncbi:MAG: DUF1573 domain-containing protein [candidate division Zixibacteria bacterium]|nr:DUF1573 domain-containing protein [candidate division Zixibacteria bacterium]
MSLLLILTSGAVGEPSEEAARPGRLVYSEQVFDFGHVGIDFMLFHTYYIVNNGSEPVPIKRVATSCDCSHIRTTDSQIDPGDTAFFHLDFLTRNYYGPTTKSATVELDDPEYPEVKFYYLSTIGQWYGNLKPKPFSLFFLPGAGAKNVTLKNRAFDQISWELVDCGDTTFDIDLVKPKAARGEILTIRVTPAEGLASGTYSSSFTLHVTTAKDQKPVILTIPVKIVKY